MSERSAAGRRREGMARRPGSIGLGLVLVLAALAAPPVAAAQEEVEPEDAGSLLEALRDGNTVLGFRYRYELVDQDGIDDEAHASTLRTTLSYRSETFRGFDVFLQAENVTDLGAGDLHVNAGFGDRSNEVVGRPVIADPEITAINQGFLRYRSGDTEVVAGRQEILLDDQRFVGAVGWRQHHQSFRSIRATNRSLRDTTLQYAYVDRVYRITGARQDADVHLFRARHALAATDAAVTAYAYLLDFEDAPALSTNTFGVEIAGTLALGDGFELPWEGELATQRDAGDNPLRVRAEYAHLMVGIARDGYRARVGWERLGGEPGEGAFTTTLATLHAFNGWADKFLATPVNGLEDLYVRIDGPLGPVRWVVVLHDFDAATGDAHYGRELDFQLVWRSDWEQTFALKGAIYDADDRFTDTTKLWLYSTISF